MRLGCVGCGGKVFGVVPFVAALSAASPVAAHSELRSSSPESGAVLECAPAQIALEFTEGVQLTALRLHRVEGDEVALPRRAIREAKSEIIALPPLEPGAFRAEWRVISADGHPVGGVIPFSVLGACVK